MRFLALVLTSFLLVGCSSGSNNNKPTDSPTSTLSGLSLSSGYLTQVFEPDVLSYDGIVSTSEAAIALTVTASDPVSTIAVNGVQVIAGRRSPFIPLADDGSTEILIVVTAADGAVSTTYQLDVIKSDEPIEQVFDDEIKNSLHPWFGAKDLVVGRVITIG